MLEFPEFNSVNDCKSEANPMEAILNSRILQNFAKAKILIMAESTSTYPDTRLILFLSGGIDFHISIGHVSGHVGDNSAISEKYRTSIGIGGSRFGHLEQVSDMYRDRWKSIRHQQQHQKHKSHGLLIISIVTAFYCRYIGNA